MCDAGESNAAAVMAAKYFVYGSGRWRALDVASGRIAGWRRRARFVFLRRGRLQVARRGAVLRALRALAAGLPGAAADGPRLPTRRPERGAESVRAVHSCPHHCCTHCHSAVPCGAPGAREGAVPRVSTVTAATSPLMAAPAVTSPCKAGPSVSSPQKAGSTVNTPQKAGPTSSPRKPGPAAVNSPYKAGPAVSSPRKPGPAISSLREAGPAVSSPRKPGPAVSSLRKVRPASNLPRKVPPEDGERAQYRELVISEAELSLVRGYVSRWRAGELAQYDADEQYRRAVLYSIHPVVRLRPLAAAVLAKYRPRRAAPADTDTDHADDKENTAESTREAGPAARPQLAKRPGGADREGPSKRPRLAERTNRAASPGLAHVISNRAAPGKEYSSLEDHAIVAWLSVGERATHVKGNAIWRELQLVYPALGGRSRSWHSLRNRYLRYILPALPALRLQPALQQRLRAAAAAGSTKSKSGARRNSLLHQTPVRSASNRVAARAAGCHTPTSRSNSSSPAASPARSPRRSLRLRDTSGSKAKSPAAPPEPAAPAPPAPAPPAAAARPQRYSELTRQFAARHRPPTMESESSASSTSSTSSSSPGSARSSQASYKSPTLPAPAPRSLPKRATRKLYNPN
ncbi:unnamed protein product [Spodoptera littoralis]|uniref:TERF2-interacting telomeric protein 1 Myb domain-containing protein n=1 Tax=Spodoptera littoralis TaxID=7109 RepID=A0A9P0I9B5_SPOLI|nr:unnamed protein product [Spodoptera littoralis]CAH1642534.1 unnamed protein product [Spodoptera littoralis]